MLEAYWMGELSEKEMVAVDRLAEANEEIREELERLRKTITRYGQTTGKRPDPAVLSHVFMDIEEDSAPDRAQKVQKGRGSFGVSRPLPVWSIAASFLLLVSIGFNFYFLSELQQSREEVQVMTQEKDLLADQVKTTGEQLDYERLRIAHFLNEDNIHIRMDGSELSPRSFANVFWNKKTNAVFISVDNLPEPPHGHQYQLWAIKVGHEDPVDAGIFDHNELVQELKVIRGDVTAFAVTLEKEGGTQQASVEKTFVKGFLKKS